MQACKAVVVVVAWRVAKPGKASTDANLMSGPPFCNDPWHEISSALRNLCFPSDVYSLYGSKCA